MGRRTYEEVKEIFYSLKKGSGCEPFSECMLPFFLKWTEAVSMKIYPNIPANQRYLGYHIDKNGDIVDEYGTTADEDEEFVHQYGVAGSYVTDSVLKYFIASPYWNYNCGELICVRDYMDDAAKGVEKDFHNLFPVEWNDKPMYFDNFMASDLMTRDDKNPQKEIKEITNYYADYGEGYCMIRCNLINEIEKALAISLTFENCELHKELEFAYKVIKGWMDGDEFTFLFSDVGYFLCMDGFSSYWEGYGDGCLDYSFLMMVAAEFIEAILLKVDSINPFLEEKVRKGLKNVIV